VVARVIPVEDIHKVIRSNRVSFIVLTNHEVQIHLLPFSSKMPGLSAVGHTAQDHRVRWLPCVLFVRSSKGLGTRWWSDPVWRSDVSTARLLSSQDGTQERVHRMALLGRVED
jgi:hypothetical protein